MSMAIVYPSVTWEAGRWGHNDSPSSRGWKSQLEVVIHTNHMAIKIKTTDSDS